MVFSFFKKPTQKMPERRAAKPRGRAPESVPPNVAEEAPASLAAPLPDLEFTNSKLGSGAPAAKVERPAAKPAAPARAVIDPNLAKDDFDDAEFTESSVMGIDVDQDADPVQGDVEHVVVLFANGQETAARSLLETLIRSYPGDEGKRFWLLLLDLLQCVGDRAAFDKLALEFAETWETSPSSWRQTEPAVVLKSNGQRRLMLQGVLTAEEGAASVAELAGLVAQGLPVVVECGKLISCDDEVAGRLAAILREARRNGVAVVLKEVDGFLARLNERLTAAAAGRESDWALLLELLQRHGTQELFEERAVDYAVAFELSPPSWESMPATGPKVDAARPADDAHYLQGDLKNCRFDELVDVLDGHDLPIIDFSGVRSMDFFSAGQLVNRIAPYKAQGQEILIRSPNHLVAELMAVVGLNKQARIIVPKS
ncbi:STAS domain-containing protein [Azonexus sp.]|jgi:anti-anti-sigma regulatory factor|uniref:STAS domain-containing protein n=1 Tax=Azonexus sp. TaxID=1872668 RepID=UPI00282F8292|nr:STAS domain-containing protein [Azonexus sp.]MDR1994223.1 hypothetical protein [Azonexus sp.]